MMHSYCNLSRLDLAKRRPRSSYVIYTIIIIADTEHPRFERSVDVWLIAGKIGLGVLFEGPRELTIPRSCALAP